MNIDIFNTDKKYNIIYANPPWKSSLKSILDLPIQNIAADNCALFLWCTFPKLPQQLKVLESWGFKYITVGFTWIKTNKNNGKPFFGIGHYTKSNSEICVLAIKGKMKPISNKVSSIIVEPRQVGARKPDCIRWKIEHLFGDLPRIELFSKVDVDGWDYWTTSV